MLGAAQAVLDSSGAARASVGPQRAGHRWIVRRAVLRASAGKPTARVYRDSETVSSFMDGTRSADLNSADYMAGIELYSGQALLCVWTGGTPGAAVTLSLDGEIISGYEDKEPE